MSRLIAATMLAAMLGLIESAARADEPGLGRVSGART
jgi:hypothetical protein